MLKISIAKEGSPEEEKGESKKYEEYELKNHMNTLMDAEKIKQNGDLMKQLKPHIEAHKKAAKKISSLKELKDAAKSRLKELENKEPMKDKESKKEDAEEAY